MNTLPSDVLHLIGAFLPPLCETDDVKHLEDVAKHKLTRQACRMHTFKYSYVQPMCLTHTPESKIKMGKIVDATMHHHMLHNSMYGYVHFRDTQTAKAAQAMAPLWLDDKQMCCGGMGVKLKLRNTDGTINFKHAPDMSSGCITM